MCECNDKTKKMHKVGDDYVCFHCALINRLDSLINSVDNVNYAIRSLDNV